MENKLDLLPLLDYIDPSVLDYQEWVNVGMALKAEGYSVSVWMIGAGEMLEDTTQMNVEKNGRRSEVIPAHQ